MRICHVITTLVFGGAERLLIEICNQQAKADVVHVVYLKGEPHLQSALDPSITVHRIDLDRRCARRLRSLLMEMAPDILHTHLGHADLIGMWAARGLPLRRFCTIHSTWTKQNWKDYLIFFAYAVLFRTVAADCRIASISSAVGEHVRKWMRVPESRLWVIRNGIPPLPNALSRSECRRRIGIPEGMPCLLFLGRLHIQKSVDTLLSAVAKARSGIPGLIVLIVGTGGEESRLKEMSRALGLSDTVDFRGPTREPEIYFQAADLFALPSVTEGLGLVVLEAFRAGTPVIATDIEGPREIIENGRNGMLVPPRNPRLLADGLVSLFRDPAKLKSLGEAGRKTYLEGFTLEKYMRRLGEFYDSSVQEPRA